MATLSRAATRLATATKTPYLLIAAAVAIALACSAADGGALAATPGTSGGTEQAAPQGTAPQPEGQADPNRQSLNDQQNGSKGVITPPPTGDHDIQTTVPNPNAGSPQEVIPAPGSPGGNQNVEPR